MPLLISCQACAFQQVVADDAAFEALKARHEDHRGSRHVVSVVSRAVR